MSSQCIPCDRNSFVSERKAEKTSSQQRGTQRKQGGELLHTHEEGSPHSEVEIRAQDAGHLVLVEELKNAHAFRRLKHKERH